MRPPGSWPEFPFIGAITLLTRTCRPEERAKMQALNDFMILGTSTVSSFSSGRATCRIGLDDGAADGDAVCRGCRRGDRVVALEHRAFAAELCGRLTGATLPDCNSSGMFRRI